MTGARKILPLFLVALGVPLTIHAQVRVPGFPPGKWWKDRRFVEELKLTSEQQGKIESIWRENRKHLIDQKAELDKRQLDLADALSQDSVDEVSSLKAFEQVQAARMAIERTTFQMRIRTKNILSMEQQQKLEEISERMRRGRNPQGGERAIPSRPESFEVGPRRVSPPNEPPPRPPDDLNAMPEHLQVSY